MRRIFSLALGLMIFAVMLCSCSADDSDTKNNSTVTEEYNITTEDVNDINTDKNSAVAKDYNITLTTEKDVYDTNSDIVNYTIYNHDNTVITTGESYLEKYDNDTWTKVEVNVPVYASSLRIEPNESKELSLPVTDTDAIEKGKYRVCQDIGVGEITGEVTTFDLDNGEEYTVNEVDSETHQELTLYGEFTVE